MIIRLALLLFAFTSYSVISKAQYFEDAFRFSNTNYALGSTARMQSSGGAQIALGGDISSAVSNPAGLGFFNKSVFTITPSIDFINVDTEYGLIFADGYESQNTEETFRNNFNFANIGVVLNFNKGRFTNDKFKGGSLALSLSRNNTYHLNRTYEGENNFNSLSDALAIDAGTTSTSFFEDEFDRVGNVEFYDQAAYLSYLISPSVDGSDNLEGYFADFDGFPVQREVIEEKGSHYQFNIAWGGNYDDRIYFGGGMGAQILNYEVTRNYQEFDFGTFDTAGDFVPDPRLNAVFVDDDISVRGVGVNFNAGVIFRPIEFLTVGASYTSPSFISIDEESFFDFEVDWKDGATFDDGTNVIDLNAEERLYQSSLFVNEYRLRTPSRIGLGTALFVGKSGFLSADVEFVDYANMNLNADNFSVSDDNNTINDLYESVMNIRAGGEYRFDSFRLRAGYAYLPNPVIDSTIDDRTNITFGFGYRTSDYFIDFAVIQSRYQTEASPYSIDASQSLDNLEQAQPLATSDVRNTTVSVTFGLNF